MLSDKLREKNRRHYDDIQEALRSKRPLDEIVDRADIPDLVGSDWRHFPDLNRDEVGNLFAIRRIRNEMVHSARPGDCTIEEANAIIGLCARVLERCGLSAATEEVRRLARSGQLEQEQRDLAALGSDWPSLRLWFSADEGRRKRHASAYEALEQGEREYRG